MAIEPRVAAVFIHVSDMPRAIRWYSRLLGLPKVQTSHEGLIYGLPLAGETGIILDGHAHARGSSVDRQGVRLMFQANDLETAYNHAQRLADNVSIPEDIGSVTVFYMEDPDGNLICVNSPND